MTARSIYSLLLVTLLALALPSCRKVTVGYLDTTHATFASKELKVYRTVADDDPHSLPAYPGRLGYESRELPVPQRRRR